MGKASRTKQDGDRRARIAAQREAERRAAQRKRIYLAGGSILVVAIVVIALVLVKLNSGGGTAAPTSNGPTGTALASLTKQVEDVPASVTDKVAGGGVSAGLFVSTATAAEASTASTQLGSYFGTVNSSTPLTSGGKPEVLYLGSEYCPFCATQRWAMINALSRFGTFSGLTTTHSSSSDSTRTRRPTRSTSRRTRASTSASSRSRKTRTTASATRPVRRSGTRRCRPRRRRSSSSQRPTTRGTARAARSPSSTSATSTSRSATSRRSARRCWRARPGHRSALP